MPEDDIDQYPILICVAGSRSFHDVVLFDIFVRIFVSWAGSQKYAFISGAAARGADRMIIDWAEANNVPCFQFPAQWSKYGNAAGMIRNAEMRKKLTHLLVFWDGKSKGTKEMIEQTQKKKGVHVSLFRVEPDADWVEPESKPKDTTFSKKRLKAKHHGRKSKSS